MIELAAVLAIMAILLAVATMSLRGACQTARQQYAVEQLKNFDTVVRENARLHGRAATIAIDINQNTLTVTEDEREKARFSTTVGGGFRIVRAFVGRRTLSSGRARIRVSDHGATPTYVLELQSGSEPSRRLLFAGVSGQVTEFEEDKPLRQLFDVLGSTRFNPR